MNGEIKRRIRQRQILHWAQGGRCAGCGQQMALKRGLPRNRPDYPTYDHIVLKSRGGGHGLVNGLLKHFACNMSRGSDPPTGCDRVWHAVVLERLYSHAATERWRLEMHKPETFVVGRQEKALRTGKCPPIVAAGDVRLSGNPGSILNQSPYAPKGRGHQTYFFAGNLPRTSLSRCNYRGIYGCENQDRERRRSRL